MAARGILACVALAALLVNVSHAEDEIFESPIKNITASKKDYVQVYITTKSGTTMEECYVEIPDGTVFELYPKSNSTVSSIKLYGASCGVMISPVDLIHRGEWRLTAHHKNETNGVKTLTIQPMSLKVDFTTEESENPLKTIITKRKDKITQSIPLPSFMYELQTCFLKTVDGTIYQLYPFANSNITDTNIKSYKSILFDECGVEISNINISYVGKWVLYSHIESTKKEIYVTQPLEIKIEEEIDTIPPKSLSVYKGEDVVLQLSETVNNLSQCAIFEPGNHNKQSDYEMVKTTQCDLILRNVTSKYNGQWLIKAYGQITLYGKLNVIVQDIPEVVTEYSIELGNSANLTFGPENSVSCQATDPKGVVHERQDGQCLFRLERATKAHHGTWKVRVGLPGMTRLQSYDYFVAVIENVTDKLSSEKVLSTVELRSDKRELFIVCSLMVSSMKSCQMIRADRELFTLTPSTGNGRYSYYGNYTYQDVNGNNIVDCGIKVEYPEAVDLQNWQCIIRHGDNNTEVGGFVNILETSGNVSNTDKGNTKVLKHTVGESFEMMCTHTDKIGYCWFQSPNKTNFVSIPDGTNQDYEYVGKGYSFGECGIKIKSAALVDSGTWTCSMGVSEAEDIQKEISVEVYESVLVAFSEYTSGKHLTFGCRTYDKSSLEYCRFVRPDGKGINPQYGYMNNYFGNGTDLEEGICQLTVLKTCRTDLGTWTCAGKPFLKAEEYYDTIKLIEFSITGHYSSTWMALSWTFYVVTFFGLIFIISSIVHRTRVGSHIRQRAASFRSSFSFKEREVTKA